jgi:hypothetical protein
MATFTYAELADLCFKLYQAFSILESGDREEKSDVKTEKVDSISAAQMPYKRNSNLSILSNELPEVIDTRDFTENLSIDESKQPEKSKTMYTIEDLDKMTYNQVKNLANTLSGRDIEKELYEDNASKRKILVETILNLYSQSTKWETDYTVEDLYKMTYNQIKKLAHELTGSSTGKREALIEAILGACSQQPKLETEKTNPDVEIDKLWKAVNSCEDEELRDVLKNSGLGWLGKHEALVDKVIRAIGEGKVANPLDSLENNDGTDETPEEVEKEPTVVDIFPVFKPNYDKKNITEARRKTMNEVFDDLKAVALDEKLIEELDSNLVDFLRKESFDPTKYSAEEKLRFFGEIRCLYIDDDGEEHNDHEIYIQNGKRACCGAIMPYDRKRQQWVCESCDNQVVK